jgi:glycosyltransferase involved in cell wall biosynthesis
VLKVLHVVATDTLRGAETFAADLRRELDRSGIDQETTALTQGRTVLHDRLRTFRPTVVLAHGGQSLKAFAFHSGRPPLIYRRIGMAPRHLRSGIRRLLYGQLMRRAWRIITVADAVALETLSLFPLSADRVRTIPNGVDPSRLGEENDPDAVRREFGLPTNASLVLSLGALSMEKDPITHLEISELVLQARPDAIHLVVGDGPLRPLAERRAAGSRVADRIHFLGTRLDVGRLMAASDVLIFASRPDGMEGMPAVLIEAGMSGIPVVGFDVAGAGEVVVDGVTGKLVPWRDIDAMTASVLAILEEPNVRRRLGAAARERCLTRFSISAIAPRYLELLQEACNA